MYQFWTLFWMVSVQDSNSVFGDIGATHCWSHWSCTIFCLCGDWHPRQKIGTNYTSVHAYPESHYIVILMKTATEWRPPPLDLCSFGMDMKGGILVLAIFHAPAEPDALIDAITCGCVAEERLAVHIKASTITLHALWFVTVHRMICVVALLNSRGGKS